MTASETTTYRMIGLSHGDTNQNYPEIDFAFYLAAGGSLVVYESGAYIYYAGTYATGDVLRVAVEGGVVKYRKNGSLLYTSTVAPAYPLPVDTSLYSNGSTLTNVVISGSGSGPVNLALNKPATQSTTHAPGITDAGKAVDGNTDGALWNGYSSATNYAYQSWWQVDLQSVQSIGSIEVWGRTDCCQDMTSNFYVLVSDQPFVSNDLATARAQAGVSSYYVQGYSGTPGTLNVNRSGRYVRVQLAGTDYLVLAEVKVWQATGSASIELPPENHLILRRNPSSQLNN